MQGQFSLLRQERERRGWSRAKVEVLTEGRISQVSLERWEEGKSWPRSDSVEELCKLYGKSAKELGLDRSSDIIVGGDRNVTSNSQEETSMSDLVRRAIFSNLASKLTGLIDLWPKRNYHYEELQGEINKVVVDYNAVVAQDSIYELTRRQAVKDMALVPVQLVGGIAIIESGKQKVDTDILLKHCAAGITACWYLRRGKELHFVSGVISEYIKILHPLICSHSEAHRKASATLLAQCFTLKGSLSRALESSAGTYYDEAIQYALISGNPTEQAISNNIRAMMRHWIEEREQALVDAEKAYGLMTKGTPKIIRSFIAAGLSQCQAASGCPEDAEISLKEAFDLFDPTMPISSVPYSEAILIFVAANVKQHSGLWQESVNLYEKSLAIPDISALGALQCRINYAKTEVSRDDRPRDMGLCTTLLTDGIVGARELDSKRYQHEARMVYNLFRIAWPREDAIKRLGKDHFGIRWVTK